MESMPVSRIRVWSRWLRLSHWTMALAVFGLLASGWLIGHAPTLRSEAGEFHSIFAALLIPALLVRIYLLVLGQGSDHISDCEPDRHRLRQAGQLLLFYFSLGRLPLPKWYAHNPLWGPIYLALFFFLALAALSGLALQREIAFWGGISLQHLHQLSYLLIGWFALLHIPAVFSHDAAGEGSDISSMVSGFRTFHVERPEQEAAGSTQSVSLETLRRSLRK